MSLKAEITKVGTVEKGVACGWEFNGHKQGAAFEVDLNTQLIRIGGYTLDELKSIADG